MLSQQFLDNKEIIKQNLHEPVVVIENALDLGFAETLYQELLDYQSWQRSGTEENNSSEYHQDFSYKRNDIDLQEVNAPEALKSLYSYLNSDEIRGWFSDVCGKRCDSFRASATNFTKGDHISEHNDLFVYESDNAPKYKRILTFNYYLSKGWDSKWGGNLVWKKPHKVISPEFNRLVLFNVTANSHHWVEEVLKDTGTKRLSITGWFLQEIMKEKFKLSI